MLLDHLLSVQLALLLVLLKLESVLALVDDANDDDEHVLVALVHPVAASYRAEVVQDAAAAGAAALVAAWKDQA